MILFLLFWYGYGFHLTELHGDIHVFNCNLWFGFDNGNNSSRRDLYASNAFFNIQNQLAFHRNLLIDPGPMGPG
jgi:hypothetical protein